MALNKTMYPPQKDSPTTFLLGDISATDTLMTVASAAALPQVLPYPLTLGIDKTLTETVMVTAQNLENNQLTITRGTPAYTWLAGSKVARVLTAKDFQDIQDNITDIDTTLTTVQNTVEEHNSDISALKTTVGDASSGLVKGLADEVARAAEAEEDETTRATAAETALNTNKINRTELAQVITDWGYSADNTKLLVTITRYNASTQQTSQYTKTIPAVSDEAMGIMTPEAYNEITALRNDVNTLINLGGRFIGVSFATKAALTAYAVSSSVTTGDFTYVIDDETHSGATTRYVRNETTWDYTFIIEYDPIGIANSTTLGTVKSSTTDGKVFVETDGTMSVMGWDDVKSDLSLAAPKTYVDQFNVAPTAGGTATALTVSSSTFLLVQGGKLVFIAAANNNGAATTINNIPLYKPNTTIAPKLIAGKMYTVWYDATSGGRFFLQASAEGTAVAGNVLAGKTFSNDNSIGESGILNIGEGSYPPEFFQPWIIRTSAADNQWRSVCYGNGLFVAVADYSATGNRVMTSSNGITWTIRTSAADNQWLSVCYGNGLFVAVASTGIGNRVMTSPDGIIWTIRTSAVDNNWCSVCYGNGLFVAVAADGIGNRVMSMNYSLEEIIEKHPTGIILSPFAMQTSAADNAWQSVCYGNGLFVAVAASVMTSPDGINWIIRTSASNTWRSVCYGNGLFVAVAISGTGNRVMTSPDGITWTARASAVDNEWRSVCYGNGLFVAVAYSGTGNRVMTSPDGITWTIRASAADNGWNSVCYGNGMFVAVAIGGIINSVMTSPDGITWTIRTSAASNYWYSVCYGNGLFVAVAASGTGNRVMTSPDGITWTARASVADNSWCSVCYGNGMFVAIAYSGTSNKLIMASLDGITWEIKTSIIDNQWRSVCYGNGVFVTISETGTGNRVMTANITRQEFLGSSKYIHSLGIVPAYYDSSSSVHFNLKSLIPDIYSVIGTENIIAQLVGIKQCSASGGVALTLCWNYYPDIGRLYCSIMGGGLFSSGTGTQAIIYIIM